MNKESPPQKKGYHPEDEAHRLVPIPYEQKWPNNNELFLNPDLTYVRAASEPENLQEPYDFSVGVTLRTPASEVEEAGFDDIDEGGSQ